jgi:Flp pilus assembly protein TadD
MNGDSNGAAIAYSKAIACGMDTPSVHGGLALALSRTGHPREALPQAEAAWKGHPLSANAAATLAVIASEVGDSVRAKEMVLKAIELRPDKPEYRQLAVQLSISK